jgi:phage FluMu protein Com
MTEVKCVQCKRKLFVCSDDFFKSLTKGELEIKCPKCKKVNCIKK